MRGMWKQTLDVSDVWDKANDGEISTQELSKIVYDRLFKLKNVPVDILNSFEDLSSYDCHFDDFNYAWEELYDWGDYNKNCWVKTF